MSKGRWKSKRKLTEEEETEILTQVVVGNKTQVDAAEELGISQTQISRRMKKFLAAKPPEEITNAQTMRDAILAERSEVFRSKVNTVMDKLQGPIERLSDEEMDDLLAANPAAVISGWSKAAALKAKTDVEERKIERKEIAVVLFDMRTNEDWGRFMDAAARPENDEWVPKMYDFFEQLMIKSGRIKKVEDYEEN